MLDAAERLLAQPEAADFSMRALAAEAGVGFATPFNHFGSKAAIMQALSARVIDRMAERFRSAFAARDAIERVLAMSAIAAGLLLEQPMVYRTVVGSLSMQGSEGSAVHDHSRSLWALALGDFEGIPAAIRPVAERWLAEQLAFMFRGCLSFWISGEIGDGELHRTVRRGLATVLLGFSGTKQRAFLIEDIVAEP